MKYNIGIDLSNTGCIAITQDDRIIDILKYPALEYNKSQEKIIKAKIKLLETQEKTITKIRQLKSELKALKTNGIRNYKLIYDFLMKYKNSIDNCVLERPIKQMASFATSVDSIASNFTTLGVYTAILSCLEIPYKLYPPQEWHKYFPEYANIKKCKDNKEKREKIKETSIQICYNKFVNANDFAIEKGHKKINDNICEASILSIAERIKLSSVK